MLVKDSPQPSPNGDFERLGEDFVVVDRDCDEFLRWVRGRTTPQRVVVRSAVILLASAGWTNARVATHVGVSRRTVALWKTRYRSGGPRSILADAPGRGRKPGRDVAKVSRILAATQESPPHGSRWTVRTLARAVGEPRDRATGVARAWRDACGRWLLSQRTARISFLAAQPR